MVSNRYASATDTGVRRVAGGEARPARAGGGPFGWLGRAVVRHPWRVIALWVIAAVAVIATSPGLPTTASESSFLPGSYESIRAANLQDQAFPQASHVTSSAAIVVFARADHGRLTGADSARIAAIARSLGSRYIPNIAG
jgi:putative drug exporter of the RND superfamily